MTPPIRLVPPSATRYAAFVECLADFAGTAMDGSGIFDLAALPVADVDYLDHVTTLLAQEDPETELEEPWVHCTTRWIVAADESAEQSGGQSDHQGRRQDAGRDYQQGVEPDAEILGFLAIRHRLNQYLFDQGGHIGYSVRPSARRQGIASAALELGLREAQRLGIAPVLITCDVDNTASRRTIENAGGRLENQVGDKLRFWVGDRERPTRP